MAREAIEKKLPRRSSGMPDSWRRKKISDLAASDADAYSKGSNVAKYLFIYNLILISFVFPQ